MATDLTAHGGTLQDLVVSAERRAEILQASLDLGSWTLSPRQLCDLELLLNGGFSPLAGFLGPADYESVCERMRLSSGVLWPIPVVLDVTEELAGRVGQGASLALRDPQGMVLAVLQVEEVYRPDRIAEARAVYGTESREHPGVATLLERTHPVCLGGEVRGLRLPAHHDFAPLRHAPSELRAAFLRAGWSKVVAFQTRNPMHRAHHELTRRAMIETGANLLIHPVVGETRPGDLDHFTRVRGYRALLPRYPPSTAMLSLLPLAMRLAGPREALWHAIIRRNYGCSHLIVGRDHAGPGLSSAGVSFYEPYAAQELVARHAAELGVAMVPFRRMVYLEKTGGYVSEDEAAGEAFRDLSGTELRRLLREGGEVPSWFSFPEVAAELRRSHPPRRTQGFAVFLTGLPSAGKSTIAEALRARLLERGGRRVSVLDGDLVRQHLSAGLGFSREDRDRNVSRIAFVAGEIAKHGGAVLCAAIAPFAAARREARALVEAQGGFVLVYVSTPLAVCEARDPKGAYARARAGLLTQFTGISDPYEPPADADLVIDASETTPEEAAARIERHLEREGYLGREGA